jgi:hypothetical protein
MTDKEEILCEALRQCLRGFADLGKTMLNPGQEFNPDEEAGRAIRMAKKALALAELPTQSIQL